VGLEFWLSLIGTAASLGGLAWNRQNAWKLVFMFLALSSAGVVAIRVTHERTIDRIEGQIVDRLSTSVMSADQLYENVYASDTSRLEFDEALNSAVTAGRLTGEMKAFRTPENTDVRVRVYLVKP